KDDGKPSDPYPFPTLPQGTCFPQMDPVNGFASAASGSQELVNHPLAYNMFRPVPYPPMNSNYPNLEDDRVFGVSNMEALLRYGDSGAPALTSELFRLCPLNFSKSVDAATQIASRRRRNLVTTYSFDVDRPSMTPYIWDPTAQPYQLAQRQDDPAVD